MIFPYCPDCPNSPKTANPCFISCYLYDKHNINIAVLIFFKTYVCKHESRHERKYIELKPTQKNWPTALWDFFSLLIFSVILEIIEKESWFFLTFFSCLDSKTIEGRTYLSFNFVRFSFILFCQIYSSNYIIQLNLSSEIFAVWYLQSWSHSVKVVQWGAHKRLGICVSYFLSFPFAFLSLEKLPHTLLQCRVPEGDLHCQCILSIFPASMH